MSPFHSFLIAILCLHWWTGSQYSCSRRNSIGAYIYLPRDRESWPSRRTWICRRSYNRHHRKWKSNRRITKWRASCWQAQHIPTQISHLERSPMERRWDWTFVVDGDNGCTFVVTKTTGIVVRWRSTDKEKMPGNLCCWNIAPIGWHENCNAIDIDARQLWSGNLTSPCGWPNTEPQI